MKKHMEYFLHTALVKYELEYGEISPRTIENINTFIDNYLKNMNEDDL